MDKHRDFSQLTWEQKFELARAQSSNAVRKVTTPRSLPSEKYTLPLQTK